MPTDGTMRISHSHSFNLGWQIAVRSGTCCCCAHNFSFSELSTSFNSKPPCRPTPLCKPGRLLYYRHLPTTFTRKRRHHLEAGSRCDDRAERTVDEIEQQLQHRGSRCYTNWPSTVEAGAIQVGPLPRKPGDS